MNLIRRIILKTTGYDDRVYIFRKVDNGYVFNEKIYTSQDEMFRDLIKKIKEHL